MLDHQAGEPRTKEHTLQDLRKQEERVFRGAPSAVGEMGTQTGTKDKYFQHFVDQIQIKTNKLRKDGKPPGCTVSWEEYLADSLCDVRKTMPDSIFNPVLQIPGEAVLYSPQAAFPNDAPLNRLRRTR